MDILAFIEKRSSQKIVSLSPVKSYQADGYPGITTMQPWMTPRGSRRYNMASRSYLDILDAMQLCERLRMLRSRPLETRSDDTYPIRNTLVRLELRLPHSAFLRTLSGRLLN